jgi:hypothetical protein
MPIGAGRNPTKIRSKILDYFHGLNGMHHILDKTHENLRIRMCLFEGQAKMERGHP